MPSDLFIAPARLRPYREEVGVSPARLRVGLLTTDPFLSLPVHPKCLAAVHNTGKVLESLGHFVQEALPTGLTGPTGLGEALHIISCSSLAARVENWSQRTGHPMGMDDVEPSTWMAVQKGQTFSAVQVHAAVQRLVAGVMRTPEWWQQEGDLLITPTMQQLPPLLGEHAAGSPGIAAAYGLFAMAFSLSGQPAVSLPLHWSREGLPVGVQLIADYGREDLLVQVASQLEQALPWLARLPTLHASRRFGHLS